MYSFFSFIQSHSLCLSIPSFFQYTQSKYTKAAKDLNKSRANYSELESTIGKLKTSLQVNANNQDKDRTRIQELSEEVNDE